ncbi:hypothetical protein [Deefgea piscis]|uniref:hypothetical protein n=1 Tax=Deefgea piscis TaxID=2739061 RepID=UPI001C80F546|nr:hypothetical protein [Deefgea piscis]QZA80984.1 hypothetical protein K4H25_16130 [Deefgea piscis]
MILRFALVPETAVSNNIELEPVKYSMHTPDSHLAQESVRIASTGMQLSRYSDLVLVAKIGSDRSVDYCNRVELG